ncbi:MULTISPECIES: LysR family transcriptional regulator [Thermomonosporaceae]|uniref:LysR family transcriptional regulator n=1 Tax=Thermomonosporaceae TaxID=2012 RepID=UPI00255B003B|nr:MULTISPECIES: LysR family transcriptional regulator [Thermomonosporaceae]MDL4771125.1 LysR family transcriptional regulator [Actinomadura xylanilytica]
MDLDLAQVRAFAVTVEEAHFGRAAERLGISQQALSKRIVRLEAALGARLLDRGPRGAGPTAAGRRFLEPARRALAASAEAAAAVRGAHRPLRIDVWGHLYTPMRTVASVATRIPDLALEPGPARDLPSVAAALASGGTDVGFGRVHPLPGRWDAGLTHRLVRLEPVDAVVGAGHPLAAETVLRPERLRGSVLRAPSALERLDFLARFAGHFGIDARGGGANLGSEHFLQQIRDDPGCFSLFPADSPLPDVPGIRSIPLADPTPLYAWSLLWRTGAGHPLLDTLVAGFAEEGDKSRWLEYVPGRDWLPEGERLRT